MISICTPTFNRRPFIPNIIKCVKNQTIDLSNVEWVIIDDGSDPVEDLFRNIDFITTRYIRMNDKLTIGAKRNMLCEVARGEIIVFMDDDDYYPPERVESAFTALRDNPNFDVAGTSEMYIFFTSNHKIIKFGPYSDNHATAATLAIRKKYWKKNKFPNSSIGEESQFLNGYTTPVLQLNPFNTILAFSHNHSSCDKNELLENLDNNKATITDLTFRDWNIYRVPEWIGMLQLYTCGQLKDKPDVYIEILEKKVKRLHTEVSALQNNNYQLMMKVEQQNRLIEYLRTNYSINK